MYFLCRSKSHLASVAVLAPSRNTVERYFPEVSCTGDTFSDTWILTGKEQLTLIYLHMDGIKINLEGHPGDICTLGMLSATGFCSSLWAVQVIHCSPFCVIQVLFLQLRYSLRKCVERKVSEREEEVVKKERKPTFIQPSQIPDTHLAALKER